MGEVPTYTSKPWQNADGSPKLSGMPAMSPEERAERASQIMAKAAQGYEIRELAEIATQTGADVASEATVANQRLASADPFNPANNGPGASVTPLEEVADPFNPVNNRRGGNTGASPGAKTADDPFNPPPPARSAPSGSTATPEEPTKQPSAPATEEKPPTTENPEQPAPTDPEEQQFQAEFGNILGQIQATIMSFDEGQRRSQAPLLQQFAEDLDTLESDQSLDINERRKAILAKATQLLKNLSKKTTSATK